ncbi:hypothetical protein ACFWJ4_16450 [Kitasatospora sp. NPDC127067]|uniref:hypothetical protein n=1 Tax=Kitasatospora sp. NPDC127067 TaxID=3347126 RepID=UPI00364D8609
MRSNSRPALRLSDFRPHQIEMNPGIPFSLICPDCKVWRRINRSKIQPHFLDDETTYCPASAQRVEQDVTPEQWAAQIAEGVAEIASRRPTKVLRKVPTPKPPAITQLNPAPATADTARQTYEAHRNGCSTCTGRKHCTDGGRLAATYLRLLRQEPQRRAAQARTEQEQRRTERRQAQQQPKRRAAEWRRVDRSVEDANTRRSEPLKGARSPIFPLTMPEGTPVEPLKERPKRSRTRAAA